MDAPVGQRAALAAIVAYARGRVIGRGNQLPWHHPADLAHFKAMTLSHAVIHGRRSFESIGRPLPRRRNIVLTRDRHWSAAGVEVAHDLEAAIALARESDPEPFILGGAEVYALALPLLTRLELTEIDEDHPGDAFFPAIDETAWYEHARRVEGVLCFRTLLRA